jgi:hypothetical protein
MMTQYVVSRKIHEPSNQKVLMEPIATISDGYWVIPEIQQGFQVTRARDARTSSLRTVGTTSNAIRVIAPDLKENPCEHHWIWKDPRRESDASGEVATVREALAFSRSQPFGAVRWRMIDGKRVGGFELVCARQIHKGELGRYPKIPKPTFLTPSFRNASSLPRDEYDRTSWARLDEVAELAGLRTEDLVLRHFDFSCKEIRHLEVIVTSAERLAQGMCPAPRTYHEDMLGPLVCLNPATVWLRRSFVLDVLYLKMFGYEPFVQS